MSRSPLPGREAAGERVFLGLGGNLGDPARSMRQALLGLAQMHEVRIVRLSSLYSTPPWGETNQPDFLNAVAEIRTRLLPAELLRACLAVEAGLKRKRGLRWGPRTIDIDIIAFGEREVREEGLTIPHPRLAERAFVLVPLAEIAPDFRIGGKTVRELAAAVDATGIRAVSAAGEWMPEGA